MFRISSQAVVSDTRELRMHRLLVLAGLTAAVASALAQVPAAELAKPPADARHFVIQSTGGKHGDSWSWVARRRHTHGPREHEPAWSGVRARLERQSGGRRPAISDHDPRRDAAGRRGRDLHDQRRDGKLEEPGRRRYRELFGARVLRLARRTDRHDGVVPGGAAGEA